MEGYIFDIQKFALHDGPGIRTVVFLKGCPLRCVWCCNPESQAFHPQLGYLKEKCSQCMACVPVCPENALENAGGKLEINHSKCHACGKCVVVCTENALKIYGYTSDANSIIKEVKKDMAYFNNSGAGLTLSGGEPMHQLNFTLSILKAAKAEGIHTCMETSGYKSKVAYEKVKPFTDLFLCDYKITDNSYHSRYTHVSNERIKENIDFLLTNGANVVLRCILVPGINDTPEHFEAIVQLEKKYPQLLGIDIMPYHEYGKNKYASIGRNPYEIGVSTVDDQQVDAWLETFRQLGAKKVKPG